MTITLLDRVTWTNNTTSEQHIGTVIGCEGEDFFVKFDEPIAESNDPHTHYTVGICYPDELELLEE